MTDAEFRIYKDVIDRYILKNPEEWAGFKQYIRETRSNLTDSQFGLTDAKDNMRFGGSMPAKLYNQIRLAAFRFFQKDMDLDYFDREFLTKFPQFKVAEKL